jgi:hypothetical protein
MAYMARTFVTARRALAVDLQFTRGVNAETTDGVAVAMAGASARHLHEVLTPAHPAHLPQLLLAEQCCTSTSVRRRHVSDQEQEQAQELKGTEGSECDLACVKSGNNLMQRRESTTGGSK